VDQFCGSLLWTNSEDHFLGNIPVLHCCGTFLWAGLTDDAFLCLLALHVLTAFVPPIDDSCFVARDLAGFSSDRCFLGLLEAVACGPDVYSHPMLWVPSI